MTTKTLKTLVGEGSPVRLSWLLQGTDVAPGTIRSKLSRGEPLRESDVATIRKRLRTLMRSLEKATHE